MWERERVAVLPSGGVCGETGRKGRREGGREDRHGSLSYRNLISDIAASFKMLSTIYWLSDWVLDSIDR